MANDGAWIGTGTCTCTGTVRRAARPAPVFGRPSLAVAVRAAASVCAAAGLVAALSGCAPLLLGGALVGGTMVATDRRSSGAQVDDEAIELKAVGRIGDAVGGRGQISTTSFNRLVLLTGVVPTDADRTAAGNAVAHIDNVRSVVNELTVSPFTTSLTTRSNDALLTSRVKASLVDARDLFANAFKVVTERGTVYLMGRVTEREAQRATDIASSVGGVNRVVRVFEVISESELANLPLPEKKAPTTTANPTRP